LTIIHGTGTGFGTLKNSIFCRVPITGSGWNHKFEKRVPELVPGNPKFQKWFQNWFFGTLNL
jgi:hypothetical protein